MPTRVVRHAVIQPDDPSYRIIPLTQGLNAIVDTKDLPLLSRFTWHAYHVTGSRTNYASTSIAGKTVTMHRFLMNPLIGFDVDHIDRDGLNNRRRNLRVTTRSANLFNQGLAKDNTSGVKGVHWLKRDKKWWARIRVNRKTISLGVFVNIEDAKRAYDEASIKYHGRFGVPNSKL